MQFMRLPTEMRPAFAAKVLAAGAVLGLLFGVAAHQFLFRYSEAVTLVEIGHVTAGDRANGEAILVLESVDNLAERIRGRTFNAEVAKKVGRQDAEQILSGFRYGGDAGLSTRTIWNNNQIEIRVRAKDDPTARDLAQGVADMIVAQHAVIFNQLTATITDRLKALQRWVDIALKNKQTLDQKVAESKDANPNFAILLVAGQQVDMEIARQTAVLENVRDNLLPPNSTQTRIISTTAIQPRVLASPLSMGAVGLVAGLCLSLVVLLLSPRNKDAGLSAEG